MTTSALIVSVLLLAQVDGTAEATKPDRDLRSDVRRLVRQLDADEAADRQAAEKALVELGPEIVSLLPPVTPRTSAEVKERLGRIRKTLETAAAEAVAKPTLITLQGKMTLVEALLAFEKQTNNLVVGYERRNADVEVNFDKTPYWEALDQVLDQAQLRINDYGGQENALVVQAKPETERPRFGSAHYAGVFRLEPLRIESRRDLRNPNVDVMQLTIGVSWEPRVAPIALRQQLSELTITDDRGQTLEITGAQGTRSASPESGMSAVEFGIPLALPSRDAKKIASIKGRFTALVPGRVETFEFDNLKGARDVEQERAGVVVTFERLRKNLDLYEARVAVRFDDASNALESHRGWIYRNEAYLLDRDGHKLDNVGLQATRQAANEVGVAYLFDFPDGPEGCKFVYKTPALVLQIPVEYELKDVPLP